jgi:hypothetical protein
MKKHNHKSGHQGNPGKQSDRFQNLSKKGRDQELGRVGKNIDYSSSNVKFTVKKILQQEQYAVNNHSARRT